MYKTNFYMIIRRLLFLLFIVAVHIPAEAQVKNINITVRRTEDLNSKDAAPWPGVIVYGFFNASKANAFMKKCQEEEAKGMTYAPQSESEYDALGETDQDGYCLMQLYRRETGGGHPREAGIARHDGHQSDLPGRQADGHGDQNRQTQTEE